MFCARTHFEEYLCYESNIFEAFHLKHNLKHKIVTQGLQLHLSTLSCLDHCVCEEMQSAVFGFVLHLFFERLRRLPAGTMIQMDVTSILRVMAVKQAGCFCVWTTSDVTLKLHISKLYNVCYFNE